MSRRNVHLSFGYMLGLLVLAAVATAGCKGRSEPGRKQDGRPGQLAGKGCKARADAFARWGGAVVSEGRGEPLSTRSDAPWVLVSKRASRTSGGPTLSLARGMLFFNAQIISDGVESSSAVGKSLTPHRLDISPQVIFAVSRDAEWSQVVAVVDALRARDVPRLVFVFEGRTEVKAPALAGKPQVNFDAAVASCPGALPLLRSVAGVSFFPKMARLAKELSAVAVTCNCSVDFAALRRIFWLLLQRDKAFPVAELRLEIAAHKSARVLTYPASARWASVAPHLLPLEGSSIEFRVAP